MLASPRDRVCVLDDKHGLTLARTVPTSHTRSSDSDLLISTPFNRLYAVCTVSKPTTMCAGDELQTALRANLVFSKERQTFTEWQASRLCGDSYQLYPRMDFQRAHDIPSHIVNYQPELGLRLKWFTAENDDKVYPRYYGIHPHSEFGFCFAHFRVKNKGCPHGNGCDWRHGPTWKKRSS